jgi:hypothetical protein
VSAITLEAIQAKQTELAKLIQQFSEQPKEAARTIEIEDRYVELEPGERYAGAVLDVDGNHMHDLVLMAAKPDGKLNWKGALEWAEEVGGALPTRQELSLLYANCKPHLQPVWHWSCEEHESDASSAWSCYFGLGSLGTTRKSSGGSVVAVRRV